MDETALKRLKDAIEKFNGSPDTMAAFMAGVIAAFEAVDVRFGKAWEKISELDKRTLGSVVIG